MLPPIHPNPIPGKRQEGGNRFAYAESGLVLSLDSQLKLRALYEYVEACRAALNQIQADLSLFEANPECSEYPQRVSEQLERFCIEADSWGFDALYEIGLGLQILLLNSGGRVQRNGFWEALDRGLTMLSALLEQCESDFRRRLATADVLDCINRTADS